VVQVGRDGSVKASYPKDGQFGGLTSDGANVWAIGSPGIMRMPITY